MITAKVKVVPQGGLKFGDINAFTWFICVGWEDYLFLKTGDDSAVGFYLHGSEVFGQEFWFAGTDPVWPATKVNIEAEVE